MTSPLRNLLCCALLALLGAGCMGTPTRGILLPGKLKGARLTADGDDPERVSNAIEHVVPLVAGTQVIRVEMPKMPALVQRTRIFVNDPAAERVGENVIVAKIDQGALSRTIIAFPIDALAQLGHDFEPPQAGEGVVLLCSETRTAVVIDGAPRKDPLPGKPGVRYDWYPTKPVVMKLKPGKHRIEFNKPGFRPYACELEVHAGEYEVVGVTLAKEPSAGPEEAPPAPVPAEGAKPKGGS